MAMGESAARLLPQHTGAGNGTSIERHDCRSCPPETDWRPTRDIRRSVVNGHWGLAWVRVSSKPGAMEAAVWMCSGQKR